MGLGCQMICWDDAFCSRLAEKGFYVIRFDNRDTGLSTKFGSAGKPIPGVEIKIDRPDANGVGEILIKGANVMQGYWKQPQERAKVFRNGWLLTGDIGYEDTDGYFYITDRKKDMLLVNGINVYPREIEELLYQFPGIKEAAVIGVPDERKGEQPLAFVSLDQRLDASLDEKALFQFLRKRLADYKVPRRVVVLEARELGWT